MSLISHEISRADNAGEISQFRSTLPIMQKQYQGKNEVVLYAENGGYPPTQNGYIRSLFLLLSQPSPFYLSTS